MKRSSLRYTLLTYRLDQLWFPAALWALFVIICIVMSGDVRVAGIEREYLGVAIPLVGGILAAYAVLDDPALELRFSTPISPSRMLIERLAVTFAAQTVCALAFQVFGLLMKADLSPYYKNWYDIQLAWIIPTFALMALGSLGAIVSAQTMAGAVLAGVTWLVELLTRDLLAAQPVGRYLLVFMSPLITDHPAIRLNELSLVSLTVLSTIVSVLLLRRQERYI